MTHLKERVLRAIDAARREQSSLPPEVLALPGMSSPKVRHLLSNLPASRYMEVGVWKGSTLVSACHGRNILAFAFDDFSQFTDTDPAPAFRENIRRWLEPCQVTFRNCSFFDVPQPELPRDVDLYFYDGLHGYDAQRRAIVHAWPSLASEAVIVVDDADFGDTIPGTDAGLAEVGADVLYKTHLPADHNGDVLKWWNGIYLIIVQKHFRT